MTKISKDTMVQIHYVLKDSNGNVLDSSEGQEPFEYLHGNGNLIPGLEKVLEGKSEGDSFTATVQPEDAYGEYDLNMIVDVPREQFDESVDIRVGMKFNASTAGGPMQVVVVNVTDTTVTVDGNHEFAGKTLFFDVDVVGVRKATESELMPKMNACGGCSGMAQSCGGGCGSMAGACACGSAGNSCGCGGACC